MRPLIRLVYIKINYKKEKGSGVEVACNNASESIFRCCLSPAGEFILKVLHKTHHNFLKEICIINICMFKIYIIIILIKYNTKIINDIV